MQYMHLQGIGRVPAKPAADLKVGDILSWNYSALSYEVVAIEVTSAQFLTITERNRKTGAEYRRRIRRTTLVCATNDQGVPQ